MTKCHQRCAHREMVNDYRAERHRQEIAAENDYRHRDGNPHGTTRLITFKDWIVGRARR